MKKLMIFTLYSEKGASSQYRAYIFREELEKNFDAKWFYFWDEKYVTKYMHNKRKYILPILFKYIISAIKRIYQLIFIASKADVVFLQKASIPKCKYVFLKHLKKKNIKIVFDVDDAVYTLKRDNSNLIATLSDTVICGNKTLYKHYSQFNDKCIVLPTVENTFKYESYWSETFNNKIIGWIGSKTTINNLDIVIDSINNIIERHPEVSVAIISNTALDYTTKIKNSYLVKWDSKTYIEELSKFTIGIMPLKFNEFNKGKCGFKLIQYLNMRKPVIGSDVGVNSEIIVGNGLIANTSDEWENAFDKLLFDESFYYSCVKHIDDVFFNKYHFQLITNELIKILNDGE